VANLAILTQNELIFVHDDPEMQRIDDETRYGGVWKYVPLRRLIDVSIGSEHNALVHLHLDLIGDASLEIPFSATQIKEVEELTIAIRENIHSNLQGHRNLILRPND
jgi:hypothetical protein